MHVKSLQIIGKALGHKSVASTQIYSRLMNDPVRKAMESAQEQIRRLGKFEPATDPSKFGVLREMLWLSAVNVFLSNASFCFIYIESSSSFASSGATESVENLTVSD